MEEMDLSGVPWFSWNQTMWHIYYGTYELSMVVYGPRQHPCENHGSVRAPWWNMVGVCGHWFPPGVLEVGIKIMDETFLHDFIMEEMKLA
jgi:hypothetical protein